MEKEVHCEDVSVEMLSRILNVPEYIVVRNIAYFRKVYSEKVKEGILRNVK